VGSLLGMKRYLIIAEGHSGDSLAKTMQGILRYAPHPTVAIVDSGRAGESEQGVPIVARVADGMRYEPTVAVIGVAPPGGGLTDRWRALLRSAIEQGLDLEAGLHSFLGDDAELVGAARVHGVELRDLRRPPEGIGVPTGANLRHGAFVVHTVGSDCAIGKKTMALELDLEARRRGLASVFVPTGQTGIAIAGWGIAVDAVISDFVAGAAERLVVEGAKRGRLLWVEGQGSIVHPSYSGVTLGLYHGAMPHLLVLCHRAGDTEVALVPGHHAIPPLEELVQRYEAVALPARPARVGAIALNTVNLGEDEARRAIADAEGETRLPADDPVRFGAARLVQAIVDQAAALGWPTTGRESLAA
jgi:uncharacterized NAD-dependent epimerase/dehydratase family protein